MNLINKSLRFIENGQPTEREVAYALLILRIVAAVFFIKFGYGKLFGTPGIDGFTGMLTMLSFPLPALFAYLVGIAEFFGGIAILLGVATRFSAFWLLVVSFAAWAGAKSFGLAMLVTMPNGNPFAGGVVDWLAIGLVLALLIAGPGSISLSTHIKKSHTKENT